MKSKAPLILLLCFWGIVAIGFGQKTAVQDIYIIYVDKNPSNDGLPGVVMDDLINAMDTLKEKSFLFFISDKKNFQATENSQAVMKLMDGLIAKNTQFPDQNFDTEILRDKLWQKLKDYKGKVHLLFYVTDRFVASLQEKYSPLLGLFPKELAHLYSDGVKNVDVTINYPKIAASRVDELQVKAALDFNVAGAGDPLVHYYLHRF